MKCINFNCTNSIEQGIGYLCSTAPSESSGSLFLCMPCAKQLEHEGMRKVKPRWVLIVYRENDRLRSEEVQANYGMLSRVFRNMVMQDTKRTGVCSDTLAFLASVYPQTVGMQWSDILKYCKQHYGIEHVVSIIWNTEDFRS